jgi:hypothetical protein
MPLEISRGLGDVYYYKSRVPTKDRNATNLKTLTDHPRFATSLHKVFNSEARVSDESVLESVARR